MIIRHSKAVLTTQQGNSFYSKYPQKSTFAGVFLGCLSLNWFRSHLGLLVEDPMDEDSRDVIDVVRFSRPNIVSNLCPESTAQRGHPTVTNCKACKMGRNSRWLQLSKGKYLRFCQRRDSWSQGLELTHAENRSQQSLR
jgi:hypothetical protein